MLEQNSEKQKRCTLSQKHLGGAEVSAHMNMWMELGGLIASVYINCFFFTFSSLLFFSQAARQSQIPPDSYHEKHRDLIEDGK